jgi:hypothetical protein
MRVFASRIAGAPAVIAAVSAVGAGAAMSCGAPPESYTSSCEATRSAGDDVLGEHLHIW